MKKMYVIVASKHGSTAQIGQKIAERLATHNLYVELKSVKDASVDLDTSDAIVLGSAVYAGQWLKEGEQFIQKNRSILLQKKVWMFSSGPLGEPPYQKKNMQSR